MFSSAGKSGTNALAFVAVVWLLSRLVVGAAMFGIAPRLDAPADGIRPEPSWTNLTWWDSGWYGFIATQGYEYRQDGLQHNVAFFPLYPLLTRGVMTMTGLPFEVAGPILSNLAFLAALLLLYLWVYETHGEHSVARWATAILAFCPCSLFCSAAYTEGLFLLVSIAAMRSFQNKHYMLAALFGAAVTATRLNGAVLIPAFLATSWVEKRRPAAYVSALLCGGGLGAFMLFCAVRFNDPLAFLHAQSAWRGSAGLDWRGWFNIILHGLTGPVRWEVYPPCGGFIKVLMLFGGALLLWQFRKTLSRVAWFYSIAGLLLVIATGSVTSVDRYIYGIAPLSIGLGILFSRHRRWGYPAIAYSALLLGNFAVRFAQRLWVA